MYYCIIEHTSLSLNAKQEQSHYSVRTHIYYLCLADIEHGMPIMVALK